MPRSGRQIRFRHKLGRYLNGPFFRPAACQSELLDEIVRLSPAECLLPDRRGELFEAQAKKLAKGISSYRRDDYTEAELVFRPLSGKTTAAETFRNRDTRRFRNPRMTTMRGYPPCRGVNRISQRNTERPRWPIFPQSKKITRKKFLHIDYTSLQSLKSCEQFAPRAKGVTARLS